MRLNLSLDVSTANEDSKLKKTHDFFILLTVICKCLRPHIEKIYMAIKHNSWSKVLRRLNNRQTDVVALAARTYLILLLELVGERTTFPLIAWSSQGVIFFVSGGYIFTLGQ